MSAAITYIVQATASRLRDTRVQEALVVLLLSLFLIALGESILQDGKYFAAAIVVLSAILLMLINMRIALFLFIAFLCGYEEFVLSSSEAFYEEGIRGSIQAVRIAGLGMMDFCMLLFFVPALIKTWYNKTYHNTPVFQPFDIYIAPIAALWFYGVVLGLFHALTLSAYAADTRILGYMLVLYFIATRTLQKPGDYFIVIATMYGTVFLKTFIFVARYFMGGGRMQGYGYYRPLIGSDTALVGFVLALTVGMLFLAGDSKFYVKAVFVCIIGYTTMILIAGLTRSTFIFTSIAILVQFYLFRSKLKISFVVGTLGIVAAGGLSFYFFMLDEESRELISYVLNSAFNWVDAIKLYGDLSMGQRILEIINIWGTLDRGNMIFLGFGWGAPWYEVSIHHPIDLGAFSIEEQMRGVHTAAHIDATHFLLKLGLILTPVLYLSFFLILRNGLSAFYSVTDLKIKFALLGLSLMVVIFSLNFIYFVRLQFLIGIAFAGILTILYRR